MRVILTNDVVGVGDIGETVNVKAGFGRNYLIPRGLAFESDARSAKVIEHKMRHIVAKKSKLKVDAQGAGAQLSDLVVELKLRVGESGKVFGSIGTRDIARELVSLGFDIDRRRIVLSDPIRRTGEHKVPVKLHPEVSVEVSVHVGEIAPTKKEQEQDIDRAREALERAPKEEEDLDMDDYGLDDE